MTRTKKSAPKKTIAKKAAPKKTIAKKAAPKKASAQRAPKSKVAARLQTLGIDLPAAAAPVANYVPWTLCGKFLFISGQGPVVDGRVVFAGRVGDQLSVEEGYKAARFCAINILAQAKAALGNLDRIKRLAKLGGFVAAASDFTDHPKVVNGASDLMVEVLGDSGRHARFAVGAPSLPLNFAVEVDAIFEIR